MQMKALTGDECLAGLWYNTILEDILWYVEDAAALEDDQRLPGPSWSWASLMAPISYADLDEFCRLDFKVKLLEAVCTPAGHDQTGEILSGRLKLSGKLLRSYIEKPTRDEREDTHKYAIRVNNHYLDNFYNDEQFHSELKTETYCLLVARRQHDIGVSGDLEYPSFFEMPETITNLGLALAPVDTIAFGYRRIGYFEHIVSTKGNFTQVRDDFWAAEELVVTIV